MSNMKKNDKHLPRVQVSSLILGIGLNATPVEVKKAFKVCSLKWHPDKRGGSTEAFQELQLAYQVMLKHAQHQDEEQSRLFRARQQAAAKKAADDKFNAKLNAVIAKSDANQKRFKEKFQAGGIRCDEHLQAFYARKRVKQRLGGSYGMDKEEEEKEEVDKQEPPPTRSGYGKSAKKVLRNGGVYLFAFVIAASIAIIFFVLALTVYHGRRVFLIHFMGETKGNAHLLAACTRDSVGSVCIWLNSGIWSKAEGLYIKDEEN